MRPTSPGCRSALARAPESSSNRYIGGKPTLVLALCVLGLPLLCEQSSAQTLTLVENGEARCTILVGQDATEAEGHAAAELAHFLEEISGATVPVRSEEEEEVAGTVVCIGPGKALAATGIDLSSETLGGEGFVIRTSGSALGIAGGRPRGTLYGVYSFLEDDLGCRWFTPDCSRIPHQDTVRIGPIQRTVVPALEYRATDYPDSRDADWAVRNKINGTQTHLDARRGGKIAYSHFVHTFNSILDPDEHFAEHPEYFSEIEGERKGGRTQLCLTNPDVRRIAIETVERWIAEAPEATIFSVSQNDWHDYCTCENCSALAAREGSQSGPLLEFVNEIADAVGEEHPDKLISTLAYQYTRKPPRAIRPHDNVTVRLCSIECCFAHPLGTRGDPENEKFVEDVRRWSEICDRLYVWDYVIDYSHSIMPFPNLFSLRPNIRFFVDHGVKGIYEEACYFTKGAELAELRTWILAKTLWDPDYDTDRAIDEFLEGYYGPAAGPLRAYIDLLHEKVQRENIHFTIWTPPTSPAFEKDLIDRSVELFDEAEGTVREDPILRHRVELARLPLRYVRIARGIDAIDREAADAPAAERVAAWLDAFESVAKSEGITHVREGGRGSLEDWLQRMRDRL